ncbi:MAG: hypothetical protein ACJA2M_001436 [Polaribacter sp.]|jgi:hypothetical protein|tara:strand:+ start:1289 stop:2173 length:885 start_codon:yes stop_codon:yes gene_type:complete
MKIYMCIRGTLSPFWKDCKKMYLPGGVSAGNLSKEKKSHIINEAMKIYLAGGNSGYKWAGDYNENIKELKPFILESFYYLKGHDEWITELRPFFKDFILDSGAFTYMNNLKESPNWDKYIEEYAAFINKHQIDLFIELDIDGIVGLKEVQRLRKKLEKLTKKKSIPVWHKSRGLENWKQITKDYDYVSIGGIVTKEIKGNEYDVFTPLLKIAAKNNCKVHGLGFTNLQGLKKYKFYSVDSTAWVYGNRGGFLYLFKNNELTKIQPKGKRLKGRKAALHNFCQWLNFSQYAENNL